MLVRRELTIEDYKSIARRRVWILILPAMILTVAAYVAALFLPKRYTSETVVLVEQPSVNENIIRPILSAGDTNQRLASMQEQILSRTGLQQIIEKFGLYRDDRRSTLDEQVVRLRKSITGMIFPRKLITPSIKSGALGTEVISGTRTISRTAAIRTPYVSLPIRKPTT